MSKEKKKCSQCSAELLEDEIKWGVCVDCEYEYDYENDEY